jgi:exodeoxyribonuclease VII large subunit
MNTQQSVTEVLSVARALLAPLGTVEIEGTLAGVNRTRTGGILGEIVAYRGVGQLEARLPFVMFGQSSAQVDQFVAGTAAVLVGLIEITNTHAPLRLNVQRVVSVGVADPHGTAGRDALLEAMIADGSATRNKQRALVRNIRIIGVVAPSGGGAGRADFLTRLHDAQLGVQIVEERAPMSGPTAAASIGNAITRLGHTDVIVIARGGGPASELTTFDHPIIATAIARSAVPVLIAVGHSTDRTLADLVAAFSVATPTAAATWIIDHNAASTREAISLAIDDAQQQLRRRETTLAQSAKAHDHRIQRDEARLRNARRITIAAVIAILIIAVLIGAR